MLHDLEIAERFITMLAARLDMETGRLELANAGGCKVVVFDGINGASKALDIGGIPIGIFPDFQGESATLNLRPGMGILLYSDGVTEAGYKAATEAGGSLKLACLGAQVAEVFALTRLDRVFEVFPDTKSAVESFAGLPRPT